MPPPAARRSLTVRLARDGGTLRRSFDLPEPLRADDAWASHGPALGDLAGLLDGPPADAERLIAGDTRARAGQALFQALFARESTLEGVLRALLARPNGPAPKAAEQAFRVRVLTADPLLLGLPWRLTTFAGKRLTELGWTFEVTHPDALRPGPAAPWDRTFVGVDVASRDALDSRAAILELGFPPRGSSAPSPSLCNVHLTAPGVGRGPRILVIAPRVYRGTPLHTETHVRELRRELAGLGAQVDDPASFNLVRTPAGLRQALSKLAPEIVYYYGEATVASGAACLLLAGPFGGASPVPFAAVAAWMRASPPAALYLNARFDDAAMWRAAVLELGREVPLLVANRTRAWSSEARRTALGWLADALSAGGDPSAAVHAESAQLGLYGASATLHTAYDRWSEAPARPPPRAEVARDLTFEGQCSSALHHAVRLLQSQVRRVLALIAPAPPPSFGAPGARPFTVEAEIASADLSLRCIHVPFQVDREAPLEALKAALFEALDVSGTLTEALSRLTTGANRAAPVDPARDRTLVWLDWGTLGESDGATWKLLAAWLELGAEVLAPACPREVRVVSSLALRPGAVKRGALAAWLAERRVAARSFDHVLLAEVGRLDADEVRAFVEAARPDTCPHALVAAAAALIFKRAAGDHAETEALVARAQATSWPALVRSLRGEPEPALPEDGA